MHLRETNFLCYAFPPSKPWVPIQEKIVRQPALDDLHISIHVNKIVKLINDCQRHDCPLNAL